jgi:hypothetical protein
MGYVREWNSKLLERVMMGGCFKMEFVWLVCENVHRTGLAKDGLTGGLY